MPLWILSSATGSLRSTAWTTAPSVPFSFFGGGVSLIGHILWILSLYSKTPSPNSFHILLGRNSSILKMDTEQPSETSASTCKPKRHSITWTTPKLEAWKCIVLHVMTRCAPYVPYIDWCRFKTDKSFRNPHRQEQTMWDMENSVVMKRGIAAPCWLHIFCS